MQGNNEKAESTVGYSHDEQKHFCCFDKWQIFNRKSRTTNETQGFTQWKPLIFAKIVKLA